jgi:small-conductance mechanosensitive channel
LAFALQSILENFVAGVLLQVRRPFEKGDEIESQDYTGIITSVDSRTMTVCTPSGETVRLPNAEVIRHPIANLTEQGRRRTTLEVGVAYGTDLRRAIGIARSALDGLDGVLQNPAPEVVSTGFGDSSLDLAVLFWHGPSIAEKRRVTDQVMVAIDVAFAEHDVNIPFPQRTLHLAPRAEGVLRAARNDE